jgi:hypothetical protein
MIAYWRAVYNERDGRYVHVGITGRLVTRNKHTLCCTHIRVQERRSRIGAEGCHVKMSRSFVPA